MVLFAEGGPLYAKELHQFPRVFLPMALRGVGRNRCRGTPNLRGHPEGHLSGKRSRHPVAHLRESHPFLPNPQIPVRPNKPIFCHRLSHRPYSLLPIPHLSVVATVSSASNATTNKLPGAKRLHSLQDRGGGHAVADAHDLQAELSVGGFEAGEHLRHEAGPGGPQGMAVGYGPAPGVYPLHVGG